MSVLVEFSMSPMDKGASVSKYVGRSLEIIEASKIAYKLGPMGTCLEGEWNEVFDVIARCYERMSQDCERITCTIKVDSRKGQVDRLNAKLASVERVVGRKLNT
ncbi:MAG: MTH1187 family thiamine-binding protein [Pseudomonadota bacterium]